MAKNHNSYRLMVGLLIFCGLIGGFRNHELMAQGGHESRTGSGISEIFKSQIGTREEYGRPNRGKKVEEYLAATQTPPGFAWCASFVKWCHTQAGINTTPANAWSPSWFPAQRVVYERGKSPLKGGQGGIQPGDVFGLYYQNLKRIGHVGFIEEVQEKYFVTVEGNTNPGGSREGDGVYRRYRPHYSISKIARWVN